MGCQRLCSIVVVVVTAPFARRPRGGGIIGVTIFIIGFITGAPFCISFNSCRSTRTPSSRQSSWRSSCNCDSLSGRSDRPSSRRSCGCGSGILGVDGCWAHTGGIAVVGVHAANVCRNARLLRRSVAARLDRTLKPTQAKMYTENVSQAVEAACACRSTLRPRAGPASPTSLRHLADVVRRVQHRTWSCSGLCNALTLSRALVGASAANG